MIKNFKIKAFKSILELELELGSVNVFIGANGSGKSNVLEAIGVLGAAAGGKVDDESLLRRGVRPGVPALYKTSFSGENVRNAIRLEASSERARFAVELRNPIRNPDPAWTYKSETLLDGNSKIVSRGTASERRFDEKRGLAALKVVEHPDSDAASLVQRLSDYAIYAPNTNTLRALVADPHNREPLGLAGGRLAEGLRSLLASQPESKFADLREEIGELITWAQSFDWVEHGSRIPQSPSGPSAKFTVRFVDRFMAKNRNTLTGYDASEGALYVLFAAIVATHSRAPKLLAIDNVDQALNPRLARVLMQKLCGWVLAQRDEKQLLLTTHNPLVLDGLDLQNDRIRLFAVDRSRKGRTIINRVLVDLDKLRRDGEVWTVSRLWVMGHLGGVPDV